MVHFKLSPNEEARILKEEREKRRKLRLQQVREQAKLNAAKLRQSVKDKKEELTEAAAKNLEKEWDVERWQKLCELKAVYEDNLDCFGEGHRKAVTENPEWKQECHELLELEERCRAEERHQLALQKQRRNMDEKQWEEQKHIKARLMALEVEKSRAQKIASLPKPKPDPVDSIEPLKLRPVKFTDSDAFITSRYHIPETVVEKENHQNQADAKSLAVAEDEKHKDAEEENKRIQSERMEKARLRHKVAIEKELLKHDYNKLIHDLSDLQRADIQRRRQAVDKLPKPLFLAPHRRLEEKEEQQLNMERAFEDMYMNATEFAGDLSIALDQPVPGNVQSPNVSTENHLLEEHEAFKDGTIHKELNGKLSPSQQSHHHLKSHFLSDGVGSRESFPVPVAQSVEKDRKSFSFRSLSSAWSRNADCLQKLRSKIEAQRELYVQKSMDQTANMENGKEAESTGSDPEVLSQSTYVVSNKDISSRFLSKRPPGNQLSKSNPLTDPLSGSELCTEDFCTPSFAQKTYQLQYSGDLTDRRSFGDTGSQLSISSHVTPSSAESQLVIEQTSPGLNLQDPVIEHLHHNPDVKSGTKSLSEEENLIRKKIELQQMEIERERKKVENELKLIEERKRLLQLKQHLSRSFSTHVSDTTQQESLSTNSELCEQTHPSTLSSISTVLPYISQPYHGGSTTGLQQIPNKSERLLHFSGSVGNLLFEPKLSAEQSVSGMDWNAEPAKQYQEELVGCQSNQESTMALARHQLRLRSEQLFEKCASQLGCYSLPLPNSLCSKGNALEQQHQRSLGAELSTIFETSEKLELSVRPMKLARYISPSEETSDTAVGEFFDESSLHSPLLTYTHNDEASNEKYNEPSDGQLMSQHDVSLWTFDHKPCGSLKNGHDRSFTPTSEQMGNKMAKEVRSIIPVNISQNQKLPFEKNENILKPSASGPADLDVSRTGRPLFSTENVTLKDWSSRNCDLKSVYLAHPNKLHIQSFKIETSQKKNDAIAMEAMNHISLPESERLRLDDLDCAESTDENPTFRNAQSLHETMTHLESGSGNIVSKVCQEDSQVWHVSGGCDKRLGQCAVGNMNQSKMSVSADFDSGQVHDTSNYRFIASRHKPEQMLKHNFYEQPITEYRNSELNVAEGGQSLKLNSDSNEDQLLSVLQGKKGMEVYKPLPENVRRSVNNSPVCDVGSGEDDGQFSFHKSQSSFLGLVPTSVEHHQSSGLVEKELSTPGLITLSRNVYQEWRQLIPDESHEVSDKGNSPKMGENQHKRSSNDSFKKCGEIGKQTMTGSGGSFTDKQLKNPTYSVEEQAYKDESVKAGYFSFQGVSGVRAVHTVPSNIRSRDCNAVWDEDSTFPMLSEEQLNSSQHSSLKLQQFLLPSMQSTLIEEDKYAQDDVQPILEHNPLVDLSQHSFSCSLNSRISSGEIQGISSTSTGTASTSQIVQDFQHCLEVPWFYHTKHQPKTSSAESISNIALRSQYRPELYAFQEEANSCGRTGGVSENLSENILCQNTGTSNKQLKEYAVDLSEKLKSGQPDVRTETKTDDQLYGGVFFDKAPDGSRIISNRWGEIFETYRTQKTNSRNGVDYDDLKYLASSAESVDMHEDENTGDNTEDQHGSNTDVYNSVKEFPDQLSSLVIQDSEPGILDEPELTLVSNNSTLLSSHALASQSSSPVRRNIDSSSLLSFERHELSLMNSSCASKFVPSSEARTKPTVGVTAQDQHSATAQYSGTSYQHSSSRETQLMPNGRTENTAPALETRESHELNREYGLSLQAAFLQKKKDFIEKSKQRVEEAKEKAKSNPDVCNQLVNRQNLTKTVSAYIKNRAVSGKPAAQSNLNMGSTVETSSEGRKFAEKEMKNRTARFYSQLEEVKLKKEEEDRKAFYAQNREKRKDYEKKFSLSKKKQPTKR